MQAHPEVEVTEVTIEPVLKKIVGVDGVPVRVDLGAHEISRKVDWLLHAIRQRPSKIFILRWHGGKVPYGAVVNGCTITWTQHGIVNAGGTWLAPTIDLPNVAVATAKTSSCSCRCSLRSRALNAPRN